MPSADMEKYRLLAAARRRREARAWLRRWPAMTWQEFQEGVDVYVSPNDGAFEVLHKYAETQTARGFLRPSMMPGLQRIVRTEIAKTFRSLDNLSFVGSLDVGTDDDLPLYGHYNPTMLTGTLHEGSVAQITGLPRKGKTNTACKLSEDWLKEYPKAFLLTNIRLDPAPANYRYIVSAKGLFLAFAEMLDRKGEFVWVLDDGGVGGVLKIEAITLRARTLGRILRIVGKMRGRFIYVEQLPEAVPTTIQEFGRMSIVCEDPGIVSIETFDLRGEHKWGIHVRGFPKTSLGYDTRDVALFDLEDCDVQKLLASIAGKEDQPEAIREFLNRPAGVTGPKAEPEWHKAVDALPEGLTDDEAGLRVGVSRSSVNEYRRRKRGMTPIPITTTDR